MVPNSILQRTPIAAVVALTLTLTLVGCGEVGSDPDVKLGVPYRAQAPSSFDCGPASVLMWRLYDGLSEVSQATIGNSMGGTSCGVTPQAVANAVNQWTATSDAYYDLAGDSEFEQFFSRQITSIDSRVPVIALIQGGLHAGVVNGGLWHTNANNDYQWDYVYFHDPQTFANDYYGADSWTDTMCPPGGTCNQITSFNAAQAWSYNLNAYGDEVVTAGGGGIGPGGPPKY
jgi:hypothetical protein